jgi:integrase
MWRGSTSGVLVARVFRWRLDLTVQEVYQLADGMHPRFRALILVAALGPDAFAFTGAKGAQLRRSTFQRHWRRGLVAAGLTARVHFHDLRHTGNTWAAEAGATLRELMDRMGHASTRAALIYIHSRDDRHKTVAQEMSEPVAEGLRDGSETADGDDLREASGT